MIYTASNKEINAEDFHKNCDNQGPTLIIIKALSSQGERIYGGYTDISWQSPDKKLF